MARTVAGQLLTDLLLTYSRPDRSSPPAKARSAQLARAQRGGQRAWPRAASGWPLRAGARLPPAPAAAPPLPAPAAPRPVRAAPHTPECGPALSSAQLVLRETGRMRPLHACAGRERCFAAAYVRLASLPSLAANLQSQERRGVLAMRKGLDAGRWERWASLLQARHMHEHRSHSKRCGQHTREALHAERPSATRAARDRLRQSSGWGGWGRAGCAAQARAVSILGQDSPWIAVPPCSNGAREGEAPLAAGVSVRGRGRKCSR